MGRGSGLLLVAVAAVAGLVWLPESLAVHSQDVVPA